MRTTSTLKRLQWIAVAAAACFVVAMIATFSYASPSMHVRGLSRSVRTLADVQATTSTPGDERREHLRAYVLGVMKDWPAARIEAVPLEDVAESIARTAAFDKPAWPDDASGARSAVLLASLGYWEGARYARYVDDGSCNDPAFRKSNPLTRYGTCDGGEAFSLWQIHARTFEAGPAEDASGKALADRDFAAHIALRMARESLAATGTLRNYTGEWTGPAPASRKRLDFADKAWRAHPYVEVSAAP